MQKLVVARCWRSFQRQQIVAINNLREALPLEEYDIEMHLCINNQEHSKIYFDIARRSIKDCPHVFYYSEKFLDDYAREQGVTDIQLKLFKKWPWIYHILLYHFLYHAKGIDYLLTYDDDIFFNCEIGEVKYLLNNKIPFAIGDSHSDLDKCLIGKLSNYFGSWIVDEYFGSFGSIYASNSGFMGLANEKIFKNFNRGDEFFEMLDFFTYKECEHSQEKRNWDQYKILLQEQSFLGILNRALTERSHIVLTEDAGYSINDLEKSKVQRYVGYAKMEEIFKERVNSQYNKILTKGW